MIAVATGLGRRPSPVAALNQAIAGELTLSLKTVRNHVSNVFNKLHVTDRAGAIVKARDAGMGRSRRD